LSIDELRKQIELALNRGIRHDLGCFLIEWIKKINLISD
jgi:hypothetical protein